MRTHFAGLSFFCVGVAAVAVLLAGEGTWVKASATAFGVASMLVFLALELHSIKRLQIWTSHAGAIQAILNYGIFLNCYQASFFKEIQQKIFTLDRYKLFIQGTKTKKS